jgi:outer membrane immunogenic protein
LFSFRFRAVHPKDVRDCQLRQLFEVPYSDAAITLRLDYLSTLRGRLGFAWDRNLVYLTGGLAAGHLKSTVNQYHPGGQGPFQTSDEHINYGYALGAGTQWAFLDNASLKIEYLWVNLPEQMYVFPRAPGFTGDNTAQTGWSGHTAKVGVDWLFH